jgi:acetyl-CoA synthetase (ADP-forming)/acetyltransferase
MSVLFADHAAQRGLSIPKLQPRTREGIAAAIADVNTSTENPIDLGVYGFSFHILAHVIRVVARDPAVDTIVPLLSADAIHSLLKRTAADPQAEETAKAVGGPELLIKAARDAGRPMVVIVTRHRDDDPAVEATRRELFLQLREAGLPVYATLTSAADGIRSCVGHRCFGAGYG